MTKTLVRVSTLLFAAAILLAGHGLQLTLLPIRAETFGWTANAIGLTGSAYFLGFVAGCLIIPGVVSQVAHIRTFMVMAAIVTAALLGAGLTESFPAWLALRFAIGLAVSGLYMSIESWLAGASSPEGRGSLLAVYSMIQLLAMTGGQSFVGLAEAGDPRLLMGAAFIVSLAIIPIGLTRMSTPPPMGRLRFSPGILLKISRVAVLCSFFGGLITGAFWSVAPLAGRALGLASSDVGFMMAMVILGGAAAQLPAGRLSDHTDRRFVIGGLFALGLAAAMLGWWLADGSPTILYAAMFAIGASVMPIYPLCIATASDDTDLPLIQIGSAILIMNSAGSILGPLLVAPLMDRLGGGGFFLFIAAAMALGVLWTVYRISLVERSRTHEHAFLAVPKSSMVATEMAEEAWQHEDAHPAETSS